MTSFWIKLAAEASSRTVDGFSRSANLAPGGLSVKMENYENRGKKFPFEIKSLDEGLNQEIKEAFKGEKDGYVQVGPMKFKFCQKFAKYADEMYGFSVRDDDIWIVSYPSAGVCLLSEMVWLICNNCDFDRSRAVDQIKRVPVFEFHTTVHDDIIEEVLKEIGDDEEKRKEFLELVSPAWQRLESINEKEKRIIKTHMPISVLPEKMYSTNSKIIYMARHPKDVASLYYQHARTIRSRHFVKGFEKFWELFENGLVINTPFWDHVKEGWGKRHDEDTLFIFFEDVVKDCRSTVLGVSNFLDKQLSDAEVDKLVEHLRCEIIGVEPGINRSYFEFLGITTEAQEIREDGEVFSEELNEKADKWIEKNYKMTDLRFPADTVE